MLRISPIALPSYLAMTRISVVIPVFNEAESPRDSSRGVVRGRRGGELRYADRVRRRRLDRRLVGDRSSGWPTTTRASSACGSAAISARRPRSAPAFDAADGELVMTLDADLQDDPREIPRFWPKLDEGFDVVSGWKADAARSRGTRCWPSRVFNWLVGWLTGVKLHDHNCGLKAFRREVFHEIRLYGELHRFVPVLAAARGFRVGETVVDHRPRTSGASKYGWSRLPRGSWTC